MSPPPLQVVSCLDMIGLDARAQKKASLLLIVSMDIAVEKGTAVGTLLDSIHSLARKPFRFFPTSFCPYAAASVSLLLAVRMEMTGSANASHGIGSETPLALTVSQKTSGVSPIVSDLSKLLILTWEI